MFVNLCSAILMNCWNANYPDSFGHYRETKITQTKHHWWWKLNHIFEHFEPLRNRMFELAILEEDHYIIPDFLMVWRLLSKMRHDYKADLITLGNYDERLLLKKKIDGVQLTDWWSSKHNMGLVIDRKFWDEFRSFSKEFCYHDDYNWDWTFQYLIKQSFKRSINTMMTSFPR